jgi:membrane fusion protein (multidrug efflux system)
MPPATAQTTDSPRQNDRPKVVPADRDEKKPATEDRQKQGGTENEKHDGQDTGGEDKDSKTQDKNDDGKHQEDNKPQEDDKPPPWHRPIFWIALAVVLIIGLAVGIPWWLHARSHEWTDDAFIDANTVSVSPQVAGHVVRRLVDDNQEVAAGQLLIQIDPRDFQDSLAEAEAAEKVAENQVAQYQSQVAVAQAQEISARADVASAQANAEQAHSDAVRYRSAAVGAVSKLQLETETNNEKTTTAQLQAAKAKLAAASAQVQSAQSQVMTAESQVKQEQTRVADAQLQLSYANICAPVAGRVTDRHVEVGSYVQIGQALLALVPRQTWVTANFKETQLQRMRPGQSVKIQVDAYSDKTFWGHVDSIAAGSGAAFSLLPAENATGNYVKVVQRVPVKIFFDQTPHELMAPGMSVVPEVALK